MRVMIENWVRNGRAGEDTWLIGGVIAASSLLLLNFSVGILSGSNRRFRRVVQGEPSLLIHDGKANLMHMAKEHVSLDELQRALREHGIQNVHDAALAVLEVAGSSSCMKYADIKPDANTHLVRRTSIHKQQ